MKSFTMFFKLTFVDLKLTLRNWMASFFTLAFPLLMLFLFGTMYGNKPSPAFGGHGSMDVTLPGYIASIIIATTGLMSLPMELVARRQQGVLRHLRATPLPAGFILGSQLLVNLIMSTLGAVLLVGGAILAYNVYLPAPGSWLAVLAAFLLGCVSISALGFLIASLARSINTARAVSMLIFYPMMFLSGGTLPLQFLPKAVQDFSEFLPVTQVVKLLQGTWFNNGWNWTAALVLAGVLAAGALVSARLFRWE